MITFFSAYVKGYLSITQNLDFSREPWEDLGGQVLSGEKDGLKFWKDVALKAGRQTSMNSSWHNCHDLTAAAYLVSTVLDK